MRASQSSRTFVALSYPSVIDITAHRSVRSNVIEHITSRRALDKTVGIAFAYYNYQAPYMSDDSFVISAFVKQLCRKKGSVPAGFLKIKQDDLSSSQLGNQESFITIAREFTEIFLVMDALDECPMSTRSKIFTFLRAVVNDLPSVKVFVTSRREMDIEEAFQRLHTPSILIEAHNVAADISRYVSDEIRRLRDGSDGKVLYIKSDALERKIVETLTEKAEGM